MKHNNHIFALGWANQQRCDAFVQWLNSVQHAFELQIATLRPASADASFRRYFRIDSKQIAYPTRIIMDAPPEKENSRPFVHVCQLMQQAGINVPQILDWNEEHGFMLLSDLGHKTVLQTIQEHPNNSGLANKLMQQTIPILVDWQLASTPGKLPEFDEAFMRRDLQLFSDWYIDKYRRICLTEEQKQVLHESENLIVQRCLASPKVYIHRDYMPRNLMVSPATANGESKLGVIDFQDALYGPITYDIASLMRDAFYSWDEEIVLDITIRYWQAARAAGLPVESDFSTFWVNVEWMGLQRHLKILGNFARLTLRDGKPKYLADTPRFLDYIRQTCSRYRELFPLFKLINQIENTPLQTAYY